MDKSLDEIIAGSAKPESAGRRTRGSSKSRGPRQRPRHAGRDRAPKKMPCVLIKNLHRSISEQDLRDLFRQTGPLERVVIDEDSEGRRTGLAWVLFEFANDAAVAVDRYDGRRAAGQIITLRKVERVGDTTSTQPSGSLGDRLGAGAGSAGRKRGGKGRRERKDASAPKRAKSAEELDAELDAYMNGPSVVHGMDSSKTAPAAEPAQPAAPTEPTAPAAQPTESAPAQDELMIE